MITTITPLRRVAVTLVLTGATAFGAVAIAPAAFADDSSTVTTQAPAAQSGDAQSGQNQGQSGQNQGQAGQNQDQSAPVATPAPVAETPVPAPVVVPPAVVVGKDGKPVTAPKTCTDKDQKEYADKLAKANQQAAPLLKAATQLRQAAAFLRSQAVPAKMSGSQIKIAQALASVGDLAASKLEAQAQALITKAGGIGCVVLDRVDGRF